MWKKQQAFQQQAFQQQTFQQQAFLQRSFWEPSQKYTQKKQSLSEYSSNNQQISSYNQIPQISLYN